MGGSSCNYPGAGDETVPVGPIDWGCGRIAKEPRARGRKRAEAKVEGARMVKRLNAKNEGGVVP